LPHHDRPPRCYFFLSYARGDDSDSIQRFYNDLCRDVRDHAGLPRGTEVGFLDTHSMDLGVAWSGRLMRDLARCGTFIALVSPRYIRSEMCGREWSVFANRLARHTSPGGEPPAALLPLLWLPPQTLPAVIQEFQYANDLLPAAYGDKGLRQMIRLDRYRNDYLEFVDSLARQIVRTAEAGHVPPMGPPLDFHQVPSVFHPAAPAGPPAKRNRRNNADAPNDRGTAVGPLRTMPAISEIPGLGESGIVDPPIVVGPPIRAGRDVPGGSPPVVEGGQSVRFVVAAPSAADVVSPALAPLGREGRYYGPTSVDWAPYVPDLTTSLAAFAQEIAEQQQFTSLVTELEGLPAALAEARAANQLVILLVDLWVTRLEGPRRVLAQYNRSAGRDRAAERNRSGRDPSGGDAGPPTAVMVPVSAADPQTQEHQAELANALSELLSDRLREMDGVMCRTSVLSHRAFDADLQVVLERVRNDAFRTRTPLHRPPGRSGSRPILQGP
jgi:FxsC-like protein